MNHRLGRPAAFWLEQILFWGRRLREHCDGIEQEAFLADEKSIDAACWCISCIGEAASRILQIDSDVEKTNPELELAAAYGMRNKLAHGYYNLDDEQIWYSATVSVPTLMQKVEQALARGFNAGP